MRYTTNVQAENSPHHIAMHRAIADPADMTVIECQKMFLHRGKVTASYLHPPCYKTANCLIIQHFIQLHPLNHLHGHQQVKKPQFTGTNISDCLDFRLC
jgi:hypothetical protein